MLCVKNDGWSSCKRQQTMVYWIDSSILYSYLCCIYLTSQVTSCTTAAHWCNNWLSHRYHTSTTSHSYQDKSNFSQTGAQLMANFIRMCKVIVMLYFKTMCYPVTCLESQFKTTKTVVIASNLAEMHTRHFQTQVNTITPTVYVQVVTAPTTKLQHNGMWCQMYHHVMSHGRN